jgi:hypothetical protein
MKSDEKINISEWVILDLLACKCLARESFNFVFRKNSYHVLKIHNFRIDLKWCFISDDWNRNRNCDFDLLTKEEWFYVETDATATSICLRCEREKQSRESRRWERLTRLYIDISHSFFFETTKFFFMSYSELNWSNFWLFS